MTLLLLLACSGSDDKKPAEDWDDLTVREKCFAGLGDEEEGMPEYDAFNPTIGRHCSGTDHQDIEGVEKVVFLGDSVTAGTPPSLEDEYYRNVLAATLQEEFDDGLEIVNCSEWGARTDDILLEPHQQILTCIPEPQDKRTLVVMTVGGNDMMEALEDLTVDEDDPADVALDADAVLANVDAYADLFDDAIRWFGDNEAEMFPAGVDVVFGNVYEFTDATGDVEACELAGAFGYETPDDEARAALREAYIHINERYMQTAVEHQRDVIFMLESFCGHGFYAGDEENECYRGEDAELWFDPTCIHPNPTGHEQIARMFADVISE